MKNKSAKNYFRLFYLLPLLLSYIILIDQSATIFRQLYIQVRYGFSITVILLSLTVFIILRMKNQYKDILLFTAILIFSSFALAGVWASGKSEPTMISGMIPIVDGENYYTDSLRWINGGSFSSYSAKRPIFTAFLTTLAKVTGQNIQYMQVLIMFLMAVSCYFSLKEIRKIINPFASTLFFVLVFLYSRQYIGCFLSETIGLILGLSGFALLFRQKDNPSHWSFYLSIFLITLALNARAGTFLILPFILLWFLKTQKNHKDKWRKIILAGCCVIFAFLINSFFMKYFGEGKNLLFSNFAYILYGLARGGAGWSQIMTDHPELFTLDAFELTKEIWLLTRQLIIQHPHDFISGLLKQYIFMFDISQTMKSVFSFANSESSTISNFVQYSLYILSLIGLFSLKKGGKNFSSLQIFSLIGFLLSVPFVPIQDTFYMRAYAATMPFIFLVPCLGIGFVTRKTAFNSNQNEDNNYGFYFFIISILIITLFIPLIIHGDNPFSNTKNIECEKEQNHIVFSVDKNSSIRIFPENRYIVNRAPNFNKSRFYQNIRIYSFSDFVDPLSEFDPPFELRVGINLTNYEDIYVVFQGENFIDNYGIYELCAKKIQYSDSPWMRELAKLYIVQNYQRIEP